MKVIVKTNFDGDHSFEVRDVYKNEVIDFLNTLEANGNLLKKCQKLQSIIDDMVNKK